MAPLGPLVDLSGTARFILADTCRVGVIAPFDFALDDEYWRWLGKGQMLCAARTPYYEHPVSVQMAEAIRDTADLAMAARSLAVVQPAATVYACTSASFIGGLAGELAMRDVMSAAGLVNPITTSGALVAALAALGARRVAIGTPYNVDLTWRLADFLGEAGYEVVGGAFLGLDGDIARVDSNSVYELARATDSPDADVIFLSCTNLRTFDVLAAAERDIGKPVLSANQVSMWAALRAAGLSAAPTGQMLFAAPDPLLTAPESLLAPREPLLATPEPLLAAHVPILGSEPPLAAQLVPFHMPEPPLAAQMPIQDPFQNTMSA